LQQVGALVDAKSRATPSPSRLRQISQHVAEAANEAEGFSASAACR